MASNTVHTNDNMAQVSGPLYALDSSGFPISPSPGTLFHKGNVLYAWAKVSGLWSWLPVSRSQIFYTETFGKSLIWVVHHNLKAKLPEIWVQAHASDGSLLRGTVSSTDENTVTVTLDAKTSGYVVVLGTDTQSIPHLNVQSLDVADGYVVASSEGLYVNGSRVITLETLNPEGLGAIPETDKGIPNGVATLDESGTLTQIQIPANVPKLYEGKLDSSVLPALAITETFVVYSEAEMLALDAQVGDVTIVITNQENEEGQSYILAEPEPSDIQSWKPLLSGSGVLSLNGRTGHVVLENIEGNAGTATKLAAPFELSLAGRVVGSVTLDGSASVVLQTELVGVSAVAYSGRYSDLLETPTIPIKVSDLTNDAQYINLDQVPVKSVATRTGDVVLDYNDIQGLATVAHSGLYTDLEARPHIPTKTSDLLNDSLYIKSEEAPVQSVAGRTGHVDLSFSDIVGLALVAHTGKYSDLEDKPSIPSKVSDLENDEAYIKANQAPVQSVNGMVGEVVVPSYVLPKATALVLGGVKIGSGINVDAEGKISVPSVSVPVQSVAGRTGNVVLSYTDIDGLASVAHTGAYADLSGRPVIPTKVSELSNDTQFITSSGAPVQSVNGHTGTVSLSFSDVGAVPVGRTINGKTLNSNVVLTASDVGAVASSSIGVANGVTPLDSEGRIPTAFLPEALTGALVYQGTWDAETNAPDLTTVGPQGSYYKVSVAGSFDLDGQDEWLVGDLVISNGTTWDRIEGGSTEVLSVFGRQGAVVLLRNDVEEALGYTPYDEANPAGYITTADLPTKISDLANDAGYITVQDTPVHSVAGRTGDVTLSTSDVSGLAAVAVSGSYNDLSDKPSPYVLAQASTTVLGGVKVDGTTISINGQGVISASGEYSLPIATTLTLGGVKQGLGVGIDNEGVLSANVVSVFGRLGAVTLEGSDVVTALGYTPYNTTNPAGYVTAAQVLNLDVNAATIKTQEATTGTTHYLTFVDSNNASATAETLFTNSGVKFYRGGENVFAVPKLLVGTGSTTLGEGGARFSGNVTANSLSASAGSLENPSFRVGMAGFYSSSSYLGIVPYIGLGEVVRIDVNGVSTPLKMTAKQVMAYSDTGYAAFCFGGNGTDFQGTISGLRWDSTAKAIYAVAQGEDVLSISTAGMSLLGGNRLLVDDGLLSTPGLAFVNDTNTGFFRPEDDVLNIVAGGVVSAQFKTAGDMSITRDLTLGRNLTSSGNFSAYKYASPSAGSAANPVFVFSGVNTGLWCNNFLDGYSLGVSVAGAEAARFTANGLVTSKNVSAGRVLVANGSLEAPSLSFANDLDTGIYRSDDGQMDVVSNANLVARFKADKSLWLAGDLTVVGNIGGTFNGNLNGVATEAQGAAGHEFWTKPSTSGLIGVLTNDYAPVYLYSNATTWGVHSSDGGTAFYYDRANQKFVFNGVTSGGSDHAATADVAALVEGRVLLIDGTRDAPSLSFINDTKTGLYLSGGALMVAVGSDDLMSPAAVFTSDKSLAVNGNVHAQGYLATNSYLNVGGTITANSHIYAGDSLNAAGNINFSGDWLVCNSLNEMMIRHEVWNQDTEEEKTRSIYSNGNGFIGFLKTDNSWAMYSDNDGNLTTTGTVSQLSDPRLKSSFSKIDNPRQILEAITGGTFTWASGIKAIASKAGQRDYGVLASAVEAVMPEIVGQFKGTEGEVYKTVAYEKLIPVLIEAIKDLYSKLKED